MVLLPDLVIKKFSLHDALDLLGCQNSLDTFMHRNIRHNLYDDLIVVYSDLTTIAAAVPAASLKFSLMLFLPLPSLVLHLLSLWLH